VGGRTPTGDAGRCLDGLEELPAQDCAERGLEQQRAMIALDRAHDQVLAEILPEVARRGLLRLEQRRGNLERRELAASETIGPNAGDQLQAEGEGGGRRQRRRQAVDGPQQRTMAGKQLRQPS
jgi:hypothetical protein